MLTLLIDRIINLFKWPMAVLSLSNLWFLCLKDMELVLSTLNGRHQHFWVGLLVYLVVWRVFFGGRLFGSWFPTFIHECIHVLFAWLTLHRVTGFSISWNKGGHVEFVGGVGNWLVIVSPYFFPLATVLALSIEFMYPLETMQRSLFLGACFGFEIVYVWRQIHPKQPDFQMVGLGFVWAFLPGAILFGYGVLLSFLLLGMDGAFDFVMSVYHHSLVLMNTVVSKVLQLV